MLCHSDRCSSCWSRYWPQSLTSSSPDSCSISELRMLNQIPARLLRPHLNSPHRLKATHGPWMHLSSCLTCAQTWAGYEDGLVGRLHICCAAMHPHQSCLVAADAKQRLPRSRHAGSATNIPAQTHTSQPLKICQRSHTVPVCACPPAIRMLPPGPCGPLSDASLAQPCPHTAVVVMLHYLGLAIPRPLLSPQKPQTRISCQRWCQSSDLYLYALILLPCACFDLGLTGLLPVLAPLVQLGPRVCPPLAPGLVGFAVLWVPLELLCVCGQVSFVRLI